MQSPLHLCDDEKGCALLEALLFLPLFALFLTVATDTGFYLTDRSSVINSLRAGLNSSSAVRAPALRLGDNGTTFLDDESIGAVLGQVTSEIASTLTSARGDAPSSSFNVFVKAISIDATGPTELGARSEGGLPRVADEASFIESESADIVNSAGSQPMQVLLFAEVSARARGLHQTLNLFGSPLVIRKRTMFLLRTQLG